MDLFKMNEKELVLYKRTAVGFIWQNNARNLIPYFRPGRTFKCRCCSTMGRRTRTRAGAAGPGGAFLKKGQQTLGAVRRRAAAVAIAIALANDPKLLLADEPTGSVDPSTASYIFDTFRRLNREMGLTIVIVTHDMSVTAKVGRVANIRDGKISSEHIMRSDYASNLEQLETLNSITSSVAESHEEFSVLDRNGRVQIPQEFLQGMGIQGNKVKMALRDGCVVISPPE
jgi:ABC-type lipoprotein export system ATPase subunit